MATLYHYLDCPYCFRVRAFLGERDVKWTSALCDRDAPPPELMSLNPLGRLPIWVTDAGKPVFGSSTIVQFVDATESGTPLLPTDPLARARVLMAEEVATEGLLLPMIKLDREIVGRQSGDWNIEVYRIETQRVRKTLQILAAFLGNRQWMVGDSLTPADLALAQPLTIVERFGLDLHGLPALADLAERLSKRPAIVAARKAPEIAKAPAIAPLNLPQLNQMAKPAQPAGDAAEKT